MTRFYAIIAILLIAPFAATGVQAQDSYQIKPGDVLQIEVLEDSTINRETLVLPDGRISVPLAGTVQVGGRTIDDVRADLTERLRPNFASDPTVFVSLSQLAEPRSRANGGSSDMVVYVLGEVNVPGKVEVRRGTTLLQLLAEVGGFSRFAALKRLQLRRTDSSGAERVYSVNYKDILAGKSTIGTTKLVQGDVIIVPQRRLFE